MYPTEYGTLLRSKFSEEEITPFSYINSHNKPTGGVWLSPLSESGSEWTDFCRKEIPDFLKRATLYKMKVDMSKILIFNQEPKKEEIEAFMKNEAYLGFFLNQNCDIWDVRSLWLKDNRAIIEILGEEKMDNDYDYR
ncbi:hypothetical protein [Rossellomorea marisflavi]|uniref:hypothetical protein n=1 Tax=Rossellomorea marisflavi TaxID=189381 RepID=UPI003F9F355D